MNWYGVSSQYESGDMMRGVVGKCWAGLKPVPELDVSEVGFGFPESQSLVRRHWDTTHDSTGHVERKEGGRFGKAAGSVDGAEVRSELDTRDGVVESFPVGVVGGSGVGAQPVAAFPDQHGGFPPGYCYLALVDGRDQCAAVLALGASPTIESVCEAVTRFLKPSELFLQPCLQAVGQGVYHVLSREEKREECFPLLRMVDVLGSEPSSVVGVGETPGDVAFLADAHSPLITRLCKDPVGTVFHAAMRASSVWPEKPAKLVLCDGIDKLVSNVGSVGVPFLSADLPGVSYAAATVTPRTSCASEVIDDFLLVVRRPPGAVGWAVVISGVGSNVRNLQVVGCEEVLDGPVVWFCSVGANVCLKLSLVGITGLVFHIATYSDMSAVDAADVKADCVYEVTEQGVKPLWPDAVGADAMCTSQGGAFSDIVRFDDVVRNGYSGYAHSGDVRVRDLRDVIIDGDVGEFVEFVQRECGVHDFPLVETAVLGVPLDCAYSVEIGKHEMAGLGLSSVYEFARLIDDCLGQLSLFETLRCFVKGREAVGVSEEKAMEILRGIGKFRSDGDVD